MNQTTRNTGVGVMHSDKMVCVDCFRSKGDGDLKLACQNPRCHFYYKEDLHQSVFSRTFSKEVGYDRKKSDLSQTPGDFLSPTHSSKMWAYRPSSPRLLKVPQVSSQKIRSKSTSATTGGTVNIRKLLTCHQQVPFVISKDEETSALHSRVTSLPEYIDSASVDESGELVEDTFLCSPLSADYLEKDRPHFDADIDVDSGISSPFGRPSAMLDWLDYSNKSSTHTSSAVPTVSSAVPTSSSVSGGAYAFDMTQLKMEMTKAIDSQVQQSLAVNDRTSPESGDMLKLSMNSSALGINGLVQCAETYSRKVFIGGLPPDIDEDDIRIFFMRFGALTVDWPHKSHSKSCIPPKGYAFLLYKSETSVHKLLLSCIAEGDKHFIYMPSSNLKKKVQVRPWYISDSYHCVDNSKPIDPRKAIFVGGVPRPLKASELAEVMTEKYGNVTFIVIDSDSDLKYPKGAACVVFSSHASYIAAVSARFMQLSYGSLDKKIEIKPYVLDGQMCDECGGVQCNGKPAPFFCGSVTCLQYYCEYCWATVHSMPGRQNHRPLLKDIGDKARFY